jgi:type I restriction enzyme R subunit
MSGWAGGKANELTFQNDMLKHLLVNGWLLGKVRAS